VSALAGARRIAASEHPLGVVGLSLCALVCVVAAGIAAAMPEGAAARWFLAGVIALALGFVCLRSTVQGVVITFLWLFALGTSRRLASEVLADPGRDPFLLVGVAAVGVLLLRALLVGALRRLTPLAWIVLAYSVLVLVQVANPDNPSGYSRITGLLVWLLPTLWFWVGRTLVDSRLARGLLLLVVGATTVIAGYGIAQTLVGFPPWDQRWINLRGYAALYIGPTTVRPFGSYASAAEFGLACAIGAAIAATMAFGPRLLLRTSDDRRAERRLRRSRNWIVLLGVAVFGVTMVALVLSAIRTYLVLLALALPVVYVVMRGRKAWKVLIPVLLLAAIGLGALSRVDPDQFEREGAQAGIRRVIAVLNDPFSGHADNYDNTLEVHWDAVRTGVEQAFDHPLGRGTGTTGISGNHSDLQTFSTDFDLSDAGIAFGLLGIVLTVLIVLLGVVSSIRVALWRRTFERVALVGVLIVSFGVWFQGAHYVMAPLLWLLLGRCDAAIARGRAADATEDRDDDADPGGPEPAVDGVAPPVAVS